MSRFLITMVLLCLLQNEAKADKKPESQHIRHGLSFLEEMGPAFAKKKSCITCHHSPFLAWAQTEALKSGHAVDSETLDATSDKTLAKLLKLQKSYQGKQWAHSLASFYVMSQVDQAQLSKREPVFDQLRQTILSAQQDNGSWRAAGQFNGQRRPKDEAHQVQTMWSILALSKLDPEDQKVIEARQSAMQWLSKQTQGESIDARVLALLIEKQWGSPQTLQERLTKLIDQQNEDGGWGWQASDPSDAWGTGMVLYAGSLLGDARLSSRNSAAHQFLSKTQQEDGSWLVATKLEPKKGKEHGSEISSFFGTVWAVIGLCRIEKDTSAVDSDKTTKLE